MASALARGLGEPVLVADIDRDRAEALAAEVGGEALGSNAEVAERADAIVLAHKPPQLDEVADEIRGHVDAVVSILGGVPVATVEAAYPGEPVYRLMPSIPVEVRRGVVCYAPGTLATEGPEAEVRELFGRLGTLIDVREDLIDAATAVMSCAPAFYALVVEALVDAGVRQGLEHGTAARMAVDTLGGTAAVLDANELDTAGLRRRVTSPGGMTERGLKVLEGDDLRGAFDRAVAAAIGSGAK